MSELRQREPAIVSTPIRESARGQSCTARFPGICYDDPETTVFNHLNGGAFGKSAARKSHDLFGFYGCFACHRYYDVGHGTRPIIDDATLYRCVLEAVCETWLRLLKAKTIAIPEDEPKQRRTKPRKPKSERRPIQTGRKMESGSRLPPRGSRPLSRKPKTKLEV
jgi:hypothetical protein